MWWGDFVLQTFQCRLAERYLGSEHALWCCGTHNVSSGSYSGSREGALRCAAGHELSGYGIKLNRLHIVGFHHDFSIAGDEQLVRDFFNACVTHKVVSTNKKGVRTVRLTNNTSMTFLFSRGGNPFQLRPFTSRNMTVDEGKALKFTVENLWIPGDKPHPTIKIEVE